jgi:hypothetical protein
MRMSRALFLGVSVLGLMVGCADEQADGAPPHDHPISAGPVALTGPDVGPVERVSVTTVDRPSRLVTGDATLPVEATVLVVAADGREPELGAIRAALQFRGVPFDVFVATTEPSLTADRRRTPSSATTSTSPPACR